MVKSMTGYGIDEFELDGTRVTIEIRSVNKRYLDIVPKLPRSFIHLESDVKKVIQSYFHRGRVEVFVALAGDPLTDRSLQVNWDLMDQYMATLTTVKNKYELQGDIPISVITAIEGLFTIEDNDVLPDAIGKLLIETLESVCQSVIVHREKEGQFLIEDIEKRIEKLNHMLTIIREKQGHVLDRYQERILERIEEHVGDKVNIDDSQLIKEVALIAEKGDITEEITRLFSHITHFTSVVKNEQPVGRKLDFITQEMHREINTIGAKSIDPDISEAVVMIKSEIEKVKEQIQNIE